jgi:hypothetical protein
MSSHDYEQTQAIDQTHESHIQPISVPSENQKKNSGNQKIEVEKDRRKHKVRRGTKKDRPEKKKKENATYPAEDVVVRYP